MTQKKLKSFFQEVAFLTVHHRELEGRAVVYPDDLEKALRKVDIDWWKDVPPRQSKDPNGYNPAQ